MQSLARLAVQRLSNTTARAGQKRLMSSSASEEESIKEMHKWKYITYAAIPVCIALGVYDLSQHHEHHDPPPAYSFLKIQSKEFPWGPCPLFDSECRKKLAAASEEE